MIESLSTEDQQLINFRYIREMTDQEIADMLDRDRSTISRRFRNILRTLKVKLGPNQPPPTES